MEKSLELWGGVECTLNRVDGRFFDQLSMSGHRDRVEADLQYFSNLGLRTLRVGVHWEHFAATNSWDWPDRLLPAMDRFGIRPIVGLVHHGSGPASTDLLDREFPGKLAAYALEVARRFPSITDYTPVNEPQTTGRFACLYGHWFPHHRSMESYLRALLHQIKGVVLAMRAIRTIQPEARLIHTEDGGATFSTPELEPFRLEREHRRWLGTDLLCGLVTRQHPLFRFLRAHGFSDREILWFTENPSPPSVIGLNYYVTSDRFLDHRTELYPPHLPGGDTGLEPLVDFEAVRVHRGPISGAGAVLSEAWQRYGIPVAITEAHLGCTVEQQMRWLAEVWQQSKDAQTAGVDVRAVTVWSLLGSFNWYNLCTENKGVYEPGAADIRSGTPVFSPLADLVSQLAQSGKLPRSLLQQPAWWRSASRFTMPPLGRPTPFPKAHEMFQDQTPETISG